MTYSNAQAIRRLLDERSIMHYYAETEHDGKMLWAITAQIGGKARVIVPSTTLTELEDWLEKPVRTKITF